MSSEALFEALRDLGWSLFTELGVPGVVRRHQQVALDPEPIVAAVPSLFELDPRLRDQVYAWCSTHAGRLSVSRLQGLSRGLPERAQTDFHRFAATLRTQAKVRWPDGDESPWQQAPVVIARRLPVERPALLRFRARALCGVGARADVMSELLSRSAEWSRASDLAEQGYSKRAIAGILSDLADAGIAKQVAEGNALTFQLSRPEHLRELLGARDLAFPPWSRIMTATLLFLDLARLEAAGTATRRIEANKRREELGRLAHQTSMDTPPVTRANPDAWEQMMAWATKMAMDLAEGTSPALRVHNVRTDRASKGA